MGNNNIKQKQKICLNNLTNIIKFDITLHSFIPYGWDVKGCAAVTGIICLAGVPVLPET